MRKLRQAPHATVVAFVALVVAISGVAVAAPSPTGHAASGKRGPRGRTGPRGPRGPAGSVGNLVLVDSPVVTLQPSQSTYDVDPNGFQATCPGNRSATGTGFNASVGTVAFVASYGSFVGGFIYNRTSIPIQVHLQAICAGVGYSGTGGAADTDSVTPAQQYRRDLAAAAR